MQNIETKTLEAINVRSLSQFLVLASVAMFLPFFIHLQWLTGPIVNAILIITLFLVGLRAAFVLALVPSLMALSGGLIPAIMAPVVPFIMISNVILILLIDIAYQKIKNNNQAYFSGLALAASAKFLFLYFCTDLVAGLILKQELATKVAQMFGLAQLLTALVGGFVAYAVLKGLKRL